MTGIDYLIFIIMDNIRAKQFFSLIENGYLPNIKILMNNGLHSDNCICDFPSVTYPTQVSIMTGTYTGDYLNEDCHGIPSFNWMDRSYDPPILRSYGSAGSDEKIQIYKLNEDIGNNCKTLFEYFPENNTSSIGQFINRGTKYFFPEKKWKLIAYYLALKSALHPEKILSWTNTLFVKKLIAILKRPKDFFESKEIPVVNVLYFFSSDVLFHLKGNNSISYINNLIHYDQLIGILIKKLKELDIYRNTLIIITSDHGNYEGKRSSNPKALLKTEGLLNYSNKRIKNANINIAEFGGVGFLYFRARSSEGKSIWMKPTLKELEHYGPMKVNLLKTLFNLDGIKRMYYFDDDNTSEKGMIHLRRKMKKDDKIENGIIEYEGKGQELKVRYVLEGDHDKIFDYPLNSLTEKVLDGKYHGINEWFEATAFLDYPLYPYLLSRYFKNPRSSDIVICTEGEVVYNIKHGKKQNDRTYSHDIGLRKSMIVPLIISGGSDEIPIKNISHCRNIDIIPTIMKIFKKSTCEKFLGKSLI